MSCKLPNLTDLEKESIRRVPEVQLASIFNSKGVQYNGNDVKITDISSRTGKVLLDTGVTVGTNIDSITVNSIPISAENISALRSDLNFVQGSVGDYVEKAVEMTNTSATIIGIATDLADASTDINSSEKTILLNAINTIAKNNKQIMPKVNVFINDKAAKTGGVIHFKEGTDVSDMFLTIGSGAQHMSPLEAYAHELYHAVTEFALRASDPAIASQLRQLKNLHSEFVQKTKSEDLAKFINHPDADTIAKDMLSYFQDRSVGLREFIVYSQTNPAMIARLKEMKTDKGVENYNNLYSKVVGKVRKLFNGLFGYINNTRKTDNDYEQMVVLTSRLFEANYNALNNKREYKMGVIETVLDKADSGISSYVERVSNSVANKALPKMKSKSLFSAAVYFAKMSGRAFVDDRAKKAILNSLSLMQQKPWETLQSVLRDMADGDAASNAVEQLQLKANQIDEARGWTATNISVGIKAAFGGSIDAFTNKALNTFTTTDAVTVMHYDNFEEVLTDKTVTTKEINRIIKELESIHGKEFTNYYVWQSAGLAYYNKDNDNGHAAQETNVEAIADRVNDSIKNRIKADEKTVKLIDELVTLYSLRLMDDSERTNLKNAMNEHPDGMATALAYLSTAKEDSKKALFGKAKDRYFYRKGYIGEVYDQEIEIITAPVKKEKEMNAAGFKLVKKHVNHPTLTNKEPLAVYINTMPTRQALHKTAFRYTDRKRKGTGLVDMYRASGEPDPYLYAGKDIRDLDKKVSRAVEEAKKGNFKVDSSLRGLIPLLDVTGQTADYRFTMSKSDKLKYMSLSDDFAKTLGHTYGSIKDKTYTPIHNKDVIEFVKEQMKNFNDKISIGKDGWLYVKVGLDSPVPGVRELWKLLPDEVREAFPKGFHIRENLLLDVMGYREYSITDSKVINAMSPELKRHLRVSETIWKEVVKMAKQTILLKMPMTLLSNVASATVQLAVYGVNPIKAVQMQLEAVRELNEYRQAIKVQMQLGPLVSAGKATAEQKKKYDLSFHAVKNTPIADLMDAGFYTQIMEDVEHTEGKGVIERKLKGIKNKAPTLARNGLEWAFLTSETPAYQLMETATQYSDFVARYAAYHTFLAKGMSKEEAIIKVRDAYINYVKPNSPMLEYYNQMGLMMFTKYFTRVQRAIREMVKGHPARAFILLASQEYLLGNVVDPTDASVLTKDLGNLFYNPFEVLSTPMAPHGLSVAGNILV
jgi:hypothetical protein